MNVAERLCELRGEVPRPFEARATTLDDRTIVAVEGELDRRNVPEVRRAARARPNLAGVLILDLSATTFVDSSGLHLIDELAAEQAAAGAPDLVLIGVPPPVERALLAASRQVRQAL